MRIIFTDHIGSWLAANILMHGAVEAQMNGDPVIEPAPEDQGWREIAVSSGCYQPTAASPTTIASRSSAKAKAAA